MAMTDCPYCFAAVDEHAAACPHCGTPLRNTPPKKAELPKSLWKEASQPHSQSTYTDPPKSNLFGNVGRAIQILAMCATIIGSVLYLLAGGVCLLLALIAWEDFFFFLLLALAFAIFGPLSCWVEGLFICGFGLIVENAEVSLAKAAHK